MTHTVPLCHTFRSKEPIQLNVWNTINLERSHRKGEIMVNKKDPVRGEAPVRRKLVTLTLACRPGGPVLCLALLVLYGILHLFDHLRALIMSSPRLRALVLVFAVVKAD